MTTTKRYPLPLAPGETRIATTADGTTVHLYWSAGGSTTTAAVRRPDGTTLQSWTEADHLAVLQIFTLSCAKLAAVLPAYPVAACADCGTDVNAPGARGLIVSTVIGKAVTEAICCHDPLDSSATLAVSACMAGFLDRAAGLLHAPVEHHGGGYAEVFVDDTHYVKISPAFGPILV